jgi:hypothetical protein
MVKNRLNMTIKKRSTVSRKSILPKSGYIYLFSAVGTDHFKIGKTCDVKTRLEDLQTGSPVKIRYVYHVYVDDANKTESRLHHSFSKKRLVGEWFRFSSQEVKEVILLMRLAAQSEPTSQAVTPILHKCEQRILDVGRQRPGEVLKARNLQQSSRFFEQIPSNDIRAIFRLLAQKGVGEIVGNGSRLGWVWKQPGN